MKTWLTHATAAPVVRRAAVSALVVGPLLIAINHGDAIVAGDVSASRLLKIALTLLIPYAVSTCSSVQAVHAGAPANLAAQSVTADISQE